MLPHILAQLPSQSLRARAQVGKAWLALARMYQHVGASGTAGMRRAAEALQHAWSVCHNCAQACGTQLRCGPSLGYLQQRVGEAIVTAAAAEAAAAAAAGGGGGGGASGGPQQGGQGQSASSNGGQGGASAAVAAAVAGKLFETQAALDRAMMPPPPPPQREGARQPAEAAA